MIPDLEDMVPGSCRRYEPAKKSPAARLNAIAAHTNRRRSSASSCSTCTAHCASAGEGDGDPRRAMMKQLMQDPEVMAEIQKDGVMDAVRDIMSAEDPRATIMGKYMGNASVMKIAQKMQAAMQQGSEEPAEEEDAPAADADPWAADLPIVDPFGSGVSLDELVESVQGITNRGRGLDLSKDTPEEQAAAFDQQMAGLRAMQEAGRKEALETGDWPTQGFYRRGSGRGNSNPLINTPGVEAIHAPNLEEMVAHNKAGTVPTPWAPHVINAHDTYAEEERWERERELFKTTAVFAGISSDLPEPNSFKRFVVLDKSVLMTRDNEGTFRCFENRCMHRGAELVNAGPGSSGTKRLHVCDFHAWTYGSDGKLMSVPEEYGFDAPDDGSGSAMERGGLTELPAAERAGMLYVIATPCSDEDAAKHFNQVCPPELEAELSEYNIGKHHTVIQQDFTIDANWKLPIDTFGETYHFRSLHPTLREVLVPNCSTFKTFGECGAGASRFCLANNSVNLLGEGAIPKDKWAQPSSLSHLVPAYHLGPNVVMLVQGQNLSFSQFWPGETVGDCVAHIVQIAPELTAGEGNRGSFIQLLNVVATEDFPLLPKMQKNFAESKHAEVIFGANEPALTDRHHCKRERVRALPTFEQTIVANRRGPVCRFCEQLWR